MAATVLQKVIMVFWKENRISPVEEPCTGVGTRMLFPWCPLWYVCRSLVSALWPCHTKYPLFRWQTGRRYGCWLYSLQRICQSCFVPPCQLQHLAWPQCCPCVSPRRCLYARPWVSLWAGDCYYCYYYLQLLYQPQLIICSQIRIIRRERGVASDQ